MTITEKDKKLLAVGGIFLVVVALVLFVIKPGFTSFSENNAKLKELKVRKDTMQTEIKALPTYEAQLKAAVEEYNATAARIYPDLTADKVQDTVMADFVNKYSLSISNLTIAEPTDTVISTFVPKSADSTAATAPATTTDTTAADTTAADTTATDPAAATPAAPGTIKLVNVSANISGGAENVIAMIDAMNAAEGVYIQQVSYTTDTEGTTASITFLMALSETFA